MRDKVVVELADGQVPVARLVPIDMPKSMADSYRGLRDLPPLGEDAESFEKDLTERRSTTQIEMAQENGQQIILVPELHDN